MILEIDGHRSHRKISGCRPLSCRRAVLAMFLAIRLVLTLETSEMSAILFSQPKQLNLVPRFSWLTVH